MSKINVLYIDLSFYCGLIVNITLKANIILYECDYGNGGISN